MTSTESRIGGDGVVGVAHIGFTVDELDSPMAMFRDLFGYELASLGPRNPRGVAMLTGLDCADIMVAHLRKEGMTGVELIAYSQPEQRRRIDIRPCDTGFAHLSFEIEDMDAMIARSAIHGLLPIGRIIGRRAAPDAPGSGQRVAYLRGGNGIAIEFIERS
jgi:hypothetical protein